MCNLTKIDCSPALSMLSCSLHLTCVFIDMLNCTEIRTWLQYTYSTTTQSHFSCIHYLPAVKLSLLVLVHTTG